MNSRNAVLALVFLPNICCHPPSSSWDTSRTLESSIFMTLADAQRPPIRSTCLGHLPEASSLFRLHLCASRHTDFILKRLGSSPYGMNSLIATGSSTP